MLHIAYDREESTEMNACYFVFDDSERIGDGFPVIYKGNYTQCLVVLGAYSESMTKYGQEMTLEEINEKCNGYLFEN